MKLGRLLLATLAYSLQNKPAAATSGRRLQSSAACSDEDSFYFDTTYTFDDATLSGCYAVESTGAEANDVHVFTVNGGEQAEGDLVFFATSSLSDDNLVWAVGVYGASDDSHSKFCYDDESNDVADIHPSAITFWCCDDGTSSGEIEAESTCNCITPTPTPSPTSPSTASPIGPPTPTPTGTSPTPEPTDEDLLSSPTNTEPDTGSASGASEEESRWLDAAWQIAITIVAGALAATGAACGSYFWRRSSSRQSAAADFA